MVPHRFDPYWLTRRQNRRVLRHVCSKQSIYDSVAAKDTKNVGRHTLHEAAERNVARFATVALCGCLRDHTRVEQDEQQTHERAAHAGVNGCIVGKGACTRRGVGYGCLTQLKVRMCG